MATLTPDDVDHIANLAKLTISTGENQTLLQELNKILAMVAEMDKVDTQQVKPLAHPYDEKQPLRPDAVTESDERKLFQSIAPKTEAGLYIVPAVIDSE